MREHPTRATRRRTTVAAVVAAVGLSTAIGAAVIGASPAHACPGHPTMHEGHPALAAE